MMYDSENIQKEIDKVKRQKMGRKKAINGIQDQNISRFKGFDGFGEFANFQKEDEVGQESKVDGLGSVQFESVGVAVTKRGNNNGKQADYDLI